DMFAHSRFSSDEAFLTAAKHAGYVDARPGSLEPPLHRRLFSFGHPIPLPQSPTSDHIPAVPLMDAVMSMWEHMIQAYIREVLSYPAFPDPVSSPVEAPRSKSPMEAVTSLIAGDTPSTIGVIVPVPRGTPLFLPGSLSPTSPRSPSPIPSSPQVLDVSREVVDLTMDDAQDFYESQEEFKDCFGRLIDRKQEDLILGQKAPPAPKQEPITSSSSQKPQGTPEPAPAPELEYPVLPPPSPVLDRPSSPTSSLPRSLPPPPDPEDPDPGAEVSDPESDDNDDNMSKVFKAFDKVSTLKSDGSNWDTWKNRVELATQSIGFSDHLTSNPNDDTEAWEAKKNDSGNLLNAIVGRLSDQIYRQYCQAHASVPHSAAWYPEIHSLLLFLATHTLSF
ncbi:hypothetical protein EV359DRAFT_69207, partial [Lentinula novae-zelandiae]